MVRSYRYGRDRKQNRHPRRRSHPRPHRQPRRHSNDYDYEDYDYEDYGPPPKKKNLSEDPRFIFGIIGAVVFVIIIVIAVSSGGEESSVYTADWYNEIDTELVEQRAAEARECSNRAGRLIEEAEKLDRDMGSKVYATPKYQEALSLLREARRIWEEIETIYEQAGKRLPGKYIHAISGVERDIQYVGRQVGVGDY